MPAQGKLNYKKLQSLLQLVDDPDEEVFATVEQAISSIGKEAIPPLESLWTITEDKQVQRRIESLIHGLQFEDLIQQWKGWIKNKGSVLDALILMGKYRYPDLDASRVIADYKKLKQDIWLELNQYLTPLEQVSVINSIVYNYYNFTGYEIYESKEDHFYIHRLFESKKGNSYAIGALLSEILKELDVPLQCIQLPHQFLLAYFETIYSFTQTDDDEAIRKLIFYVDPNNGYVHNQIDIDNYFKKIGEEPLAKYFIPLEGKELVLRLLKEIQYYLDQYGDEGAAYDFTNIIDLFQENEE